MLFGHYPFGSGGVATSVPLLSLAAIEEVANFCLPLIPYHCQGFQCYGLYFGSD